MTASTKLNNVEYALEYKVVPQSAIPAKILIGDPILDKAKVTLEKKGATVEPLVGEDYVLLLEEEKADEVDLSNVPEKFKERVQRLVEGYQPTGGRKRPLS